MKPDFKLMYPKILAEFIKIFGNCFLKIRPKICGGLNQESVFIFMVEI